MAKFWTYAEIRTKIQRDTDTEAEEFIRSDELLDLVNEAIDECEAEIHMLGVEENYFLTYADIPVTVGQELLTLPTDIYANKIKNLVYSDGSLVYPVRRLKGPKMYEEIADQQRATNVSDYYRYILINASPGPQTKILLVPKSREASTSNFRLWYLRQANRMVDDSSICDIPDFVHFIINRTIYQIWAKEGHPNQAQAKVKLEESRKLMVDTLNEMVPDGDSEIVMDLSHYYDMN